MLGECDEMRTVCEEMDRGRVLGKRAMGGNQRYSQWAFDLFLVTLALKGRGRGLKFWTVVVVVHCHLDSLLAHNYKHMYILYRHDL